MSISNQLTPTAIESAPAVGSTVTGLNGNKYAYTGYIDANGNPISLSQAQAMSGNSSIPKPEFIDPNNPNGSNIITGTNSFFNSYVSSGNNSQLNQVAASTGSGIGALLAAYNTPQTSTTQAGTSTAVTSGISSNEKWIIIIIGVLVAAKLLDWI